MKREITLPKWQSREKSGGQKERCGGLEQRQRVERLRQVEKIGETSDSKVSTESRRPGSPFHPALLQPSPQALLHVAPSRAQALNSPPTGLDSGRNADHRTFAGLGDPERPCWSAVPATWGRGVTLLLAEAFDWSEGGVLGCPPAGPLPTKAGPEGSQLEREESGRCSWKGAGPRARS